MRQQVRSFVKAPPAPTSGRDTRGAEFAAPNWNPEIAASSLSAVVNSGAAEKAAHPPERPLACPSVCLVWSRRPGLTSAHKVYDLQPVAIVAGGCAPVGAGHDLAVQLHGDAVGLHAQLFDQRVQGGGVDLRGV